MNKTAKILMLEKFGSDYEKVFKLINKLGRKNTKQQMQNIAYAILDYSQTKD